MNTEQYVHAYSVHKGSPRPMVTAAFVLDKDDEGKILGIGIGFAYCSKQDDPVRRKGNAIARGRAISAICKAREGRGWLNRDEFESDEAFVRAKSSVFVTYRSRYGQHKTVLDANNEPQQTGHPHYSYLPFPFQSEALMQLELPDDEVIGKRLLLAVENIHRRNSL